MNKIRSTLITASVMVLALSTSPVAIANALGDHTAPTTSSSSDGATSTDNKVKSEAEKLKQEAQTQKAAAESELKQKKDDARQKVCTTRKDTLQKRLNNKATAAKKHKEAFDKIFLRVTTFYEQKGLSVSDYDQLVAAVTTAQNKANSEVDALSSYDTNIDCSTPNVADTVSGFRTTLTQTRDALKAYKSALSDLIKAVHQANDASGQGQ